MNPEARQWIDKLQLQPHPEGGWYSEIYRSGHMVETPAGPRSAGTAIYFLLTGQEVSRLHRLKADELWHFYAGGPMALHLIHEDGYEALPLGTNHLFQCVPAGVWFGASLDYPHSFALVGCTVAPGFDFADFELADRATLLDRYPQYPAMIERLT